MHKTDHLNHLVNPSFHRVNRKFKQLFVLSFENEGGRTWHSNYYLPKVETKDYNVMIDSKKLFDLPINSELETSETLEKLQLIEEMITWLVVC